MIGDDSKANAQGLGQMTDATKKKWPREVPLASDAEAKLDTVPVVEHDPFAELIGGGGSEAAFTAEDARSRQGNFIVPFGLPGSGKTTFLASFFKFIDESEHLSSHIVVPQRGKILNYAGQAMLNQWQKVFNFGRFLGATPVGKDAIRELAYEVTPLKGQKTKLKFNVVEVSGEDLVSVVAREGSEPRMPDAIEALFKNKKLRTTIILVFHPDRIDNDLLFNNLFIWLNQNVSPRMKTFSLAVLIANPDLALKRLHKRRPDSIGYEKLSGNISQVYLKEFAPKTYSVFKSWDKKKRVIIPFYIGQIKKFMEGDEEFEKIINFDKTSSANSFAWIYLQFTGKKLGATYWQRFLKNMNR